MSKKQKQKQKNQLFGNNTAYWLSKEQEANTGRLPRTVSSMIERGSMGGANGDRKTINATRRRNARKLEAMADLITARKAEGKNVEGGRKMGGASDVRYKQEQASRRATRQVVQLLKGEAELPAPHVSERASEKTRTRVAEQHAADIAQFNKTLEAIGTPADRKQFTIETYTAGVINRGANVGTWKKNANGKTTARRVYLTRSKDGDKDRGTLAERHKIVGATRLRNTAKRNKK